VKNTEPILTLALDCDLAIALVKLCLNEKGFSTQHNFELDSACASFSDPLCPHQPDQLCNCQLITLQVYRSNLPVIPIIFHGHDECTEIFYTEEGSIPPDVLFAIQLAKLDKQEFNPQQ
jgi:hypothetical protein